MVFSINSLKRTFIPFIFLFCFSSAIGIFYSIHNTADSDPGTVWIFLFFGTFHYEVLSGKFWMILDFVNIESEGTFVNAAPEFIPQFF